MLFRSAVIDKIPSPPSAQATRVPKMLHPTAIHSHETVAPTNKLERDLYEGQPDSDRFTIAYVSKMFAVRADELPHNQRKPLTADDMRARAKLAREERDAKALRAAADQQATDAGLALEDRPVEVKKEEPVEDESEKNRETLIGFARQYSGTIRLGQTLYAVLPKFNADLAPSHPHNSRHLAPIKVEQLYMMMGRELVAVEEVQAGNLFAIGGLEGIVGRNATLCALEQGAEVKEGAERDADRGCLVNLAGISQTVG